MNDLGLSYDELAHELTGMLGTKVQPAVLRDLAELSGKDIYGVEIAPGLQGYKWGGCVELKTGTGYRQITVEREFGQVEEPEKTVKTEPAEDESMSLEEIIKAHHFMPEGYRFSTLPEAIRACAKRILEIKSEGGRGTDARIF